MPNPVKVNQSFKILRAKRRIVNTRLTEMVAKDPGQKKITLKAAPHIDLAVCNLGMSWVCVVICSKQRAHGGGRVGGEVTPRRVLCVCRAISKNPKGCM